MKRPAFAGSFHFVRSYVRMIASCLRIARFASGAKAYCHMPVPLKSIRRVSITLTLPSSNKYKFDKVPLKNPKPPARSNGQNPASVMFV